MAQLFRRAQIDGKGTGILAMNDMDIGTTVLTDEAVVFAVTQKFRNRVCNCCFRESETLRRCSGCKYVSYCGRNCQSNNWTDHKVECRCLKKVYPKVPPDFCILLTRILLKFYHRSSKEDRDFLNKMNSHYLDIDTSLKDKYRTFLQVAVDFLGANVMGGITIGENEIIKLMSRLATNTFSITDHNFDEKASGVFPVAWVVNHSCEPNTHPVFTGKGLALRTLCKVKCAEEITVSYVETLALKKQRQKELQDRYFFQCSCKRCINSEKERSSMVGGFCLAKRGCTGVVDVQELQGYCADCKLLTAYTPKQSPTVLMEKLEKLLAQNDIEYKDLKKSVDECEKMLHVQNIRLVTAHEKLFDICIAKEMWKEAIDVGEKAFLGIKKYYPEYHPVLATHICKLGKLYSLLGDLRKGIELLKQGVNRLSVTYGATHETVQDVIQYLAQLKAEMTA